jgi:hypothetical protein
VYEPSPLKVSIVVPETVDESTVGEPVVVPE